MNLRKVVAQRLRLSESGVDLRSDIQAVVAVNVGAKSERARKSPVPKSEEKEKR